MNFIALCICCTQPVRVYKKLNTRVWLAPVATDPDLNVYTGNVFFLIICLVCVMTLFYYEHGTVKVQQSSYFFLIVILCISIL